MISYVEIIAIVEGKTEQIFIEKLLAPYLGYKNIGLRAIQITKPGQKGGDVKFSRAQKDLGLHLKQRSDTFITTMIDYYGIKEWPGIDLIPTQATPDQIANIINEKTKEQVVSLFSQFQAEYRFIPFVAVHEFEALLFSDCKILANQLGVSELIVCNVISKFKNPEAINNSLQTAPSKRLDNWSPKKHFLKTTMGITIAEKIGIAKMREECPLFDNWLSSLENLRETAS
jgi:hypothetical protein